MRPNIAAVGLVSVMVAAPAFAHHSFAMFDATRTVVLVGTVAAFGWTNPHTHIAILVPPTEKDPALVGRWDIEGASPNIMFRQGWSKLTLKPGDKVTVAAHPLKDGAKGGSLYYAIDRGGKRLYTDINRKEPGG